jgi:hypothetical protein
VTRRRAAIPATRKQVKTKKFGNFFCQKICPSRKKSLTLHSVLWHLLESREKDAAPGDMRIEMAATQLRINQEITINSHVKDLSDYRQKSDYR